METQQDTQVRVEPPERELSPGEAAVEAAATGERLDDQQAYDALEWLLADDEEIEQETYRQKLTLNVGPGGETKIEWWIQPVDSDTLVAINKMGQNRAQRRGRQQQSGDGGATLAETNLRIVVAGTVEPDLIAAAKAKGVPDPGLVVKSRFRKMPGVIDQIAAEILSLSGYEDGVVERADMGKEVKAAGN